MMKQKNIIEYRKARHLYSIIETMEAGIILEGWQARCVRIKRCSFSSPYIIIENDKPVLIGLSIIPDVTLRRQILKETPRFSLLLHHKEIEELKKQIKIKGFTIIPLDLHYLNNRIKVTIAICKGKKSYDKREEIKQKDLEYEQRKNIL